MDNLNSSAGQAGPIGKMNSAGRQTIYLEEELAQHPRAQKIIKRFNNPCVIECGSYREVFNPRRNNFRIQKHHPALILARKHSNHVQPSPYGIGGEHNYYFSHMLNCIYDCSYCFLQALYSSAHYVIFVNYEDFFAAIAEQRAAIPAKQDAYFFSGYDCDSLAYEPVTEFAAEAFDFFAEQPRAYLELRTKSLQLAPLESREPLANAILAFSLAPPPVAQEYEQGTPATHKRLEAMGKMAARGWKLGARLDPLIWHPNWRENYKQLITNLAAQVPPDSMHSITLGTLRYPKGLAANIQRQQPQAHFLTHKMIVTDGVLRQQPQAHQEMLDLCAAELRQHYPAHIIIPNVL